jgi:sugar O-acyltransferase (sialic acid O-acetyltransferase NeuD family)
MSAARPVVILGGASGAIVAEALHDLAATGENLACVGYLNDVLPKGSRIGAHTVLGGFEAWADFPSDTHFISVLHKAKEAQRRVARIDGLGIPNDRWATVRHPSAIVARDVTIGQGSFIGPHAVLMPGVEVGRHVSLRPGCSISHDTRLGDFVFVGPNASLNGNCRAGEGAHIGPNVAILEETEIGALSVVGMGSVVLEDVSAQTLVVGNPARAVRRLDEKGAWVRLDG